MKTKLIAVVAALALGTAMTTNAMAFRHGGGRGFHGGGGVFHGGMGGAHVGGFPRSGGFGGWHGGFGGVLARDRCGGSNSARYCSYPRLMSAHRELRRIKLAAATGVDHAVASL